MEISGAQATIVLIHEALGSVSYWKNFPSQLAQRTCCNVVAYARAGHGESDGPLERRSSSYYQHQVEDVLPRLMEEFRITDPILYGHSEGAVIAFLYAAAGRPVGQSSPSRRLSLEKTEPYRQSKKWIAKNPERS